MEASEAEARRQAARALSNLAINAVATDRLLRLNGVERTLACLPRPVPPETAELGVALLRIIVSATANSKAARWRLRRLGMLPPLVQPLGVARLRPGLMLRRSTRWCLQSRPPTRWP